MPSDKSCYQRPSDKPCYWILKIDGTNSYYCGGGEPVSSEAAQRFNSEGEALAEAQRVEAIYNDPQRAMWFGKVVDGMHGKPPKLIPQRTDAPAVECNLMWGGNDKYGMQWRHSQDNIQLVLDNECDFVKLTVTICKACLRKMVLEKSGTIIKL